MSLRLKKIQDRMVALKNLTKKNKIVDLFWKRINPKRFKLSNDSRKEFQNYIIEKHLINR